MGFCNRLGGWFLSSENAWEVGNSPAKLGRPTHGESCWVSTFHWSFTFGIMFIILSQILWYSDWYVKGTLAFLLFKTHTTVLDQMKSAYSLTLKVLVHSSILKVRMKERIVLPKPSKHGCSGKVGYYYFCLCSYPGTKRLFLHSGLLIFML